MKFLTTISLFAILLSFTASAHARVWTDLTGQFRFDAELLTVSSDLDIATFLGGNGKEYELPVEALSSRDQEFVLDYAKDYAKSQRVQKSKYSISDVPQDILEKIKQAAVELWPEDEDQQMDATKSAVEKYVAMRAEKEKQSKPRQGAKSRSRAVPQSVVDRLMTDAALTWPDDKEMQVEHTRKQLGYYRIIRNYQTPKLPGLVVVQIKQNAKKVSPNDYRAQLQYLHAQVQEGIAYSAKLDLEDLASKTAQIALVDESANESGQSEELDGTWTEGTWLESAPVALYIEAPGVFNPADGTALSSHQLPPAYHHLPPSTSRCETGQQQVVRSTIPVTQKSAKSSWRWFARTQGK